MESVGGKIRYYRKKKHLKQIDLAALLNLNVCTIKRLESNQSLPSESLCRKIVIVLEVSFGEICGDYNNFLNSQFRQVLKNYRKENKLTLYQIGEILSVYKKTVSAWERGISKPQKRNYKAIQEFLDKINL